MARTCPKCGAEVYHDVCPKCHTRLSPLEQASKQRASHHEYSQRPISSVDYRNQPRNPANTAAYDLRYYKFQIKWGLWLAALWYILLSVIVFQLINVPVIGLYYLAAAVFAVYIRFQLAQRRRTAPRKYVIFRIIDSAVISSMLFWKKGVGDAEDSTGFLIVITMFTFIFYLSYVILEWRYYSKRSELFVN